MESVSLDLVNNIFEITKEKLWADFVKADKWGEDEAKRLFLNYATRTSKTGWVYLISQGGDDDFARSVFVKIGRTVKDPDVRLRTLQGQNPQKLKLLTYIFTEDSYALERELHRKFRNYRTEEGGKEWFEFPNNIAPHFGRPEWYKYFLPFHVNPDWFPEDYFEFETPEGHFFAVLRAQEHRLRMYHEMDFLKGQVRLALIEKGILKESK